MKRQIWLESHEIETVASAIERHATEAASSTGFVTQTGRRELNRLAKRFRDLLAPRPIDIEKVMK